MPDWSYRTVFRPLLFRLPDARGRDLALAAIGGLGGLPGGRRVIEWMGHMRPPAALAARIGDTPIDTPVGLAAGIDPHLVGLPGLCRLGFGFVEVGPVSVEPRAGGGVRRGSRLRLRRNAQAWDTSSALPAQGLKGSSMSVMRAVVFRPAPLATATRLSASPRACSSVAMKAPEPVFTSSTRC